MFRKQIEFICNEQYSYTDLEKPEPVKIHIPDWYKKLEHHLGKRTVKGCMPFLDTLTTGYVLKMPQDLYVEFNVDQTHPETGEIIKDEKTNKPRKDIRYSYGMKGYQDIISAKQINLNSDSRQHHEIYQLEGSRMVERNKNLSFMKILNPWTIKTPPGYSCLFVPPLNNCDDRFDIIPGIVDTDCWDIEINFPFVFNGDKYETLETVITRGTPYVQVIPFKRDSWEMKIKTQDPKSIWKNMLIHNIQLLREYKERIWKKKVWR